MRDGLLMVCDVAGLAAVHRPVMIDRHALCQGGFINGQ